MWIVKLNKNNKSVTDVEHAVDESLSERMPARTDGHINFKFSENFLIDNAVRNIYTGNRNAAKMLSPIAWKYN